MPWMSRMVSLLASHPIADVVSMNADRARMGTGWPSRYNHRWITQGAHRCRWPLISDRMSPRPAGRSADAVFAPGLRSTPVAYLLGMLCNIASRMLDHVGCVADFAAASAVQRTPPTSRREAARGPQQSPGRRRSQCRCGRGNSLQLYSVRRHRARGRSGSWPRASAPPI